MITTITPYTDSRNQALPGQGYDGVVRVSSGGYYGTGTLLYDGRAVLTAAHVFAAPDYAAQVHFETTEGMVTVQASQVSIHPDYDSVQANNDLAIVWLSSPATTAAERYDIYRDSDEIGQTMTMVGYGTPGVGATGADESYGGDLLRLKASNLCEAGAGDLKDALGYEMGWTPTTGTQLVADFDDGTTTHDALGHFLDTYDGGLGQSEGLVASGDSGGPAFIDDKVAGVATYTASLTKSGYSPDIDSESNSSFGEIAAWQRVSHYQQWVDQSLRSQYTDAPTTPDEVQKTVQEADSDTSLVYFLLQFTGVRETEDQLLSVDYQTRDGSAVAGEDYIAASGRLVLYPDEVQAVIPVEVIGDTRVEEDETFYLDVTNPVGGSFGQGVVRLTAMRTIVDDDGWA